MSDTKEVLHAKLTRLKELIKEEDTLVGDLRALGRKLDGVRAEIETLEKSRPSQVELENLLRSFLNYVYTDTYVHVIDLGRSYTVVIKI